MSTITFNNITSESLGLIVTKTPVPPCQQQSYETVYVPDGPTLYNDSKTRENVSILIECTVIEPGKLRQIYAAMQGAGNLILSNEPDVYYKAHCKSLTPTNIAQYMNAIVFEFDCEPYAYAVSNDPVNVTDNDTALEVGGSYFCQPVYKIYGSGDITLTVNRTNKPLKLFSVDGYATVDSTLLMCHKDGTLVKNSGFLPFLEVGTNRIQWNGLVSKIEITKNERWH